jgi:ABC-type Mn2+/Zn2+ transport system permease subunit
MNDLRVPIGAFFSIVGVILVIAGIAMPNARADLTTVNVNLYCGISMLVFGSVMLWLARRAS